MGKCRYLFVHRSIGVGIKANQKFISLNVPPYLFSDNCILYIKKCDTDKHNIFLVFGLNIGNLISKKKQFCDLAVLFLILFTIKTYTCSDLYIRIYILKCSHLVTQEVVCRVYTCTW